MKQMASNMIQLEKFLAYQFSLLFLLHEEIDPLVKWQMWKRDLYQSVLAMYWSTFSWQFEYFVYLLKTQKYRRKCYLYLPGNSRSTVLESTKDQGVDTRTAEVHIIRERSLFHQDSKDDCGAWVLSPSLLFLFFSKYWQMKSPVVTLVPIATVENR